MAKLNTGKQKKLHECSNSSFYSNLKLLFIYVQFSSKILCFTHLLFFRESGLEY